MATNCSTWACHAGRPGCERVSPGLESLALGQLRSELPLIAGILKAFAFSVNSVNCLQI